MEKTKEGYLNMLRRYIMQGEEDDGDKMISEVMKMIGAIRQIADIFKTSKMSFTFNQKEKQSRLLKTT